MHEAARHRHATGLAATGRVRFAHAAGRVLSLLRGRRRKRFARAGAAPDRRGRASASAPGSAFGPGGEGYLRLCFARAPAEIAEATRRDWLPRWLDARNRD